MIKSAAERNTVSLGITEGLTAMWDATPHPWLGGERARPLFDRPPSGSAAAVTARAPGLSFVPDDIRHWKPQSVPD